MADFPEKFVLGLRGSTATALQKENLEELGKITGAEVLARILSDGHSAMVEQLKAGRIDAVSSYLE